MLLYVGVYSYSFDYVKILLYVQIILFMMICNDIEVFVDKKRGRLLLTSAHDDRYLEKSLLIWRETVR